MAKQLEAKVEELEVGKLEQAQITGCILQGWWGWYGLQSSGF